MTDSENISHIYHSLFSYTLSKSEVYKWQAGPKLKLGTRHKAIAKSKEKHTDQSSKLTIAKSAALLLQKIAFIQFVGITGSLAMNNAKKESDIDLMVICSEDTLWIARALSLFLLLFSGMSLRRAKIKDEQDKVCLNLWIDTKALTWTQPKNAYIAHEIAQVVPLVNKNSTYEQWIKKNMWIFDYWTNAISKPTVIEDYKHQEITLWDITKKLINFKMYVLQKLYMKGKQTREIVNLHEAYFHPYDWGEKVMRELEEAGVVDLGT